MSDGKCEWAFGRFISSLIVLVNFHSQTVNVCDVGTPRATGNQLQPFKTRCSRWEYTGNYSDYEVWMSHLLWMTLIAEERDATTLVHDWLSRRTWRNDWTLFTPQGLGLYPSDFKEGHWAKTRGTEKSENLSNISTMVILHQSGFAGKSIL